MNFSLRKDIYNLGVLLALSVFLFGANLGSFGLLDPDEPFYSLTAREMVERHDASTPYIFGHPQFEKPIFFYWVMYACFKVFGISEWSARLGPCIAGVLTVLITYLWARALFRRSDTAFICAAILATAAQFIVVSRIVLTDVYLCLFVTAALYSFTLGYLYPRWRAAAWHLLFVFCALGFLTKGMLGFLLPFMGIGLYAVLSGELALLVRLPWLTGGLLFAIVGFPWYGLMTAQHGTGFLKHFFIHENIRRFFVAEHKGFDRFYFYPAGFLLGFFPWTFALPYGVAHTIRKAHRGLGLYRREFLLVVSFFVSGFAFFMAAKSKLLSYTFPLFPLMALMIGVWAHPFFRAVARGGNPAKPLLLLAAAVLGVMPAVLAAGVYRFGASGNFGLELPVAIYCVTALPLSWAALFSVFRKKVKTAFFLLIAMTAVFSVIGFGFLLPAADKVFASRHLAKLYEEETAGTRRGMIMGGKLFVRGARYYTGNPNVSVIVQDPKGTFYTNHTIPMISKREDLIALDAASFPIYGFYRQKDFKRLKEIASEGFKITVIEEANQRVFARLDRLT